jgi:HAD domain in Swiss Army Knife RNA repair proteins
MKIALFLDIDGVLHREARLADFAYVGARLEIDAAQHHFEWWPHLAELVAAHPVDLVIHSSWRHLYSLDELKDRFPSSLRDRVVGTTAGGDRYRSIMDYVQEHAVERFAVLDDVSEAFPPNWPHLIVCDPLQGVGDPAVQARILAFLEGA